jgi:hypothetical protein
MIELVVLCLLVVLLAMIPASVTLLLVYGMANVLSMTIQTGTAIFILVTLTAVYTGLVFLYEL